LFASDTPGPGAALTDRATANLWSVAADGSDLRSHTSLSSAEGYLREPATDGSGIVFSSRGRLFAMDSLEATPREVEVLVSGARASGVEWRGSVHALPHRGGPSRLLAGACGLRLREARPLGRTPFALFVSDAEALADREEGGVGSDVLALARLDGGGEEIRLDVGPIGRILHAVPSPDGSKIALSTHDNVVRLVALRGLEDPAKVSQHAPAADPAASAWEQDAEHAV